MKPAFWLAMARDDLRAAELLVQHGITQLSGFHAEQAVEKALIALRLHRDGAASDPSMIRSAIGAWLRPQSTATALKQAAGAGPSGRIAAGLASLALRSPARSPLSEVREEDLTREAVRVAQHLVDQITRRVYGDDEAVMPHS